MRVKLALAGEGGGARPPPFITFTITSKPCFTRKICTLWLWSSVSDTSFRDTTSMGRSKLGGGGGRRMVPEKTVYTGMHHHVKYTFTEVNIMSGFCKIWCLDSGNKLIPEICRRGRLRTIVVHSCTLQVTFPCMHPNIPRTPTFVRVHNLRRFFWPWYTMGIPVVAHFCILHLRQICQIPGVKALYLGYRDLPQVNFSPGVHTSEVQIVLRWHTHSYKHTGPYTGNFGGLFWTIGICLVLQGPYTERIDLWIKRFL